MQVKIRNSNECGGSNNLRDLIIKLEHLMYGNNYEVTLGIVRLTDCKNLNDCKNKIASVFEDAKLDRCEIKPAILKDVWGKVDFGFNYRGDEGAGLKLSKEKEDELKKLVVNYKNWITKYISPESKFYFFTFNGIPGYPVWWEYSFIILNNERESLFIYGSSSD